MTLKNYTSTVSVIRSVSFIEQKLVAHGARRIQKDYEPDGEVTAIRFCMPFKGFELYFMVSARIDDCLRVMERSFTSRTREETKKKARQQAARTAWKLVSDKVEILLSEVEMTESDVIEVFFPYLLNPTNNKTLYQQAAEGNFQKLLPGGGK
jgi:hypothetical protein